MLTGASWFLARSTAHRAQSTTLESEMRRRTLLKSLMTALAAGPMAKVRLRAQQPAELTPAQLATLGAVAEVVLPSALGADGRDLVVEQFAAWVREYREGADMGHGYGSSTLRRRSGPSPAASYPAQFAALDEAARAAGGAAFVALPADVRHAIVERALEAPQRVTRLPSQPNGANLIADFMGLYYSSPDAWDLAYGRRIGRDRCRSLEGSEERPARGSEEFSTGLRLQVPEVARANAPSKDTRPLAPNAPNLWKTPPTP
jgi:hypothetical protein